MEERKLNNQNHHHHHHHQHHHHHYHEDNDNDDEDGDGDDDDDEDDDDDDDDNEGSSCMLGGWGSMLFFSPSKFKTHDQMYMTHTIVSEFQSKKKFT